MIAPRSVRRLAAPLFVSLLIGLACGAHAAIGEGEILIGELNCAGCHHASDAVKERLASRKAPRLGEHGVNATPQWIRAFLASPQTEKPGTLMPDMLHALAPPQRAAVAEALTHYLVSLQREETGVQLGASTALIDSGRKLFHSVGCV